MSESPRFIICRAAAGSGKTYTLVRHYIEIAISSPSQLEHRFEHILAVTFTNKAANGMKSRIMATLNNIAYRPYEASTARLIGEMAEHLDIEPEEVTRRAEVVGRAILHNYSDLSVCTIDSFVHRIVRTFAHDLGLPLNFNLMIDEADILQASVDSLIHLVGRNGQEDLTSALCAFAESQMEDGHTYDVGRALRELSEQILKENANDYIKQLENIDIGKYKDIYANLKKANNQIERMLGEVARQAMSICQKHDITADYFSYKTKGSVYSLFSRYADGDFCTINAGKSNIDKALEEGRLYPKTAPADVRDKMDAVQDELIHLGMQLRDMERKYRRDYNTRTILMVNLYSMSLLGKINQVKDTYSRENDIVHISEFNKRVAEQVADEPTPFVYERIGNKYYNYLIDEFQDTSKLQWLNFLPLIDEALSHQFGADTAPVGTQSLVVGDGKQAIYRFRQGDVRQFIKLPEVDSPLHGRLLKHYAKEESLFSNYRTLDTVVEFNNRFFEWAVRERFAANEELQRLYIGGPQRVDANDKRSADLVQKPVKKGGYVQGVFCEKESIMSKVMDIVRHQVDDLHYSYKDIMILSRTNKTLSDVTEYFIANAAGRPIPMVSSESFIIANSSVVLFLRAMLTWLNDPSNRVAAITAVFHYADITGNDKREEMAWQLYEYNYDLERMFATKGISVGRNRLLSMSLYDCCEELLRRFAMECKETSYTATFLNTVANFSQTHRQNLGDFLRYLDEKIDKLSTATSEELDAVHLLTVHKAKGLEAPIVIYLPVYEDKGTSLWVSLPEDSNTELPVAYVNLKKDSESHFTAAYEEEKRMKDMDRLNQLYVGMTRPMHKLFLVCPTPTKNSKSSDEERTNNIALLYDFMKHDSRCKPLEGDNAECFSTGADEPYPTVTQDKTRHGTEIQNVVFPQWENRIGIAEQSAGILSPVEDDSRRYGVLIHDILAHVYSKNDVQSEVEKSCKKNNIDEDGRQKLYDRIMSMVCDERYQCFFEQGVHVECETPMVFHGKELRPDRIVFATDATWVVDFKTGAYNADKHRQYTAQVEEYASAISAMGYPNVEPVIVYL